MTEHNIDWDCEKAKGCDWALTPNSMGTIIFCYGKPMEDEEENRWLNAGVIAGYPLLDSYTLHTRPKAKEMIYTKQMQEAGELPDIGAFVQINDKDNGLHYNFNHGDIVECICHSIDGFERKIGVYRHGNGVSVSLCNTCIMPIDTRSDKQKLADQIDKFIIDKNINAIDTEKFIDAIMNGEFENLNFTGEK